MFKPRRTQEVNVWRLGTPTTKKELLFFKAALFFGGKWSVERKEARLTGTAQRNKENDRRETA
jgi:hypothetical protein